MDAEAAAANAGGGGPVRFPTVAVEGPTPASCSEAQTEQEDTGERQRFAVELRPGETTIVSWKRLLKESTKGGGSTLVPLPFPVFQDKVGSGGAVPSAEGELKDSPTSNRFSSVIEKIERLYMGKQSSDEEELDDIPDDDEYDTEDSFIDDAELDEYFQVDKASTKHNGYFVNKGKLEQIEASLSPNVTPKKRRRKDLARSIHNEKDGKQISKNHLNMSDTRIRAPARSIASMGKKSSGPKNVVTPFDEHYQDGGHLKNKINTPTSTYRKKSADLTIKSENPSYLKAPLQSVMKDFDEQKVGTIPSRDNTFKSRGTGESFGAIYPVARNKAIPSQVESASKKLLSGETDIEASSKIRRKERNGLGEFSPLNPSIFTYPAQVVHPSSTQMKEGFAVRSKGTTLERAIRDLEKIVALCKPPGLDIQEMDASSQGVKRRLPQEVTQKLAKVARLSASQFKISEDDLIDRLMGILGHLVQRKTLKRNMREMVELGLSAKQQKADRLQQIKKEVNEMIGTHVAIFKTKVTEPQGSSADDFQGTSIKDERRPHKGKFRMDRALEDKICDLYDLYVEGMDEDKGPQSRKLYVELAELWPSGYMDNLGIKEAIYRSKERKRAMYNRHKARDEERTKRKILASAVRVDESNLNAQVRAVQERAAIDSSTQVNISLDKQIINQPYTSSGRMAEPSPTNDFGHHLGSKHYEKMRGNSSMATDDVVNNVKKKIKRRLESDPGDTCAHPVILSQQDSKEKLKPHKHSDDDINMNKLSKSNMP
ncbi:hypothetical protein J5N97_022361 [Dioscorea zingiberensis]|uniref:Hpc2-related domain-containing protein n=1 Tax=Dioscorea zingiberensis TaxID=325984 RepID=A0A9D5HAK8_9LILI|nr:hypothetical protein J5N97_022361 [Dioscorea zingiberensis]